MGGLTYGRSGNFACICIAEPETLSATCRAVRPEATKVISRLCSSLGLLPRICISSKAQAYIYETHYLVYQKTSCVQLLAIEPCSVCWIEDALGGLALERKSLAVRTSSRSPAKQYVKKGIVAPYFRQYTRAQ